MLMIRREEERDRQAVEGMTRRAFYNQYMPGCFEHYLIRAMRGHPDFLPELNFVAELNGEVIGSIMYTRSTLTDEAGAVREAVTFGPVSIAPEHQRRGYGRQLMEHSLSYWAAPRTMWAWGFGAVSGSTCARRTEDFRRRCWSRSFAPARWMGDGGSIATAWRWPLMRRRPGGTMTPWSRWRRLGGQVRRSFLF